MSQIEAITFDFWWTLFIDDTDTGVADNWRLDHVGAALAGAGHPVARESLHAAIQRQRLHGLALQEQGGREFPPEAQVQGWLADLGLPALLLDVVYTPYISPYTEIVLPVMPDALPTLQTLASRYRLGVICNTGASPGSILRQVVAQAGLAPFLSVQTYSNEEGIAKPRSEIFHTTLDRLGVTPQAALHVGDNGQTDVVGARAAGMHAIWFRSHPGAVPPPPKQALAEISRLAELPLLLGISRS